MPPKLTSFASPQGALGVPSCGLAGAEVTAPKPSLRYLPV